MSHPRPTRPPTRRPLSSPPEPAPANASPALLLAAGALLLAAGLVLVQPALAIRCVCSYCQNLTSETPTSTLNNYELLPHEQCESQSNQSECFFSAERKYDLETKSDIIHTTYGCLAGGDSLAWTHCKTPFPKNSTTMILCCHNQDFCNIDFETPQTPIWTIEAPSLITKDQIKTLLFLVTVPVLLLAFLGLWVHVYLKHKALKETKNHIKTASSDSIKKSMCRSNSSEHTLKFDPFPLPSAMPNCLSSVTPATTSCASSDVVNKDSHARNPYGDSQSPSHDEVDLTSGVGPRLLNEPTIGRSVKNGPMTIIGEGRFGKVYKAYFNQSPIAVKAFQSIDEDAFRHEEHIYVECFIKHENILTYLSSEIVSVNHDLERWIFLEYWPLGSLYDFLNKPDNIVTPSQTSFILFSIINGLNYLHEDYGYINTRMRKKRIAHRDLKSKNILMKNPSTCCIADFGHAAVEEARNQVNLGRFAHTIQAGTIRYMAPEILDPPPTLDTHRNFNFFPKVDIYQCGLVFWEVLYRTSTPERPQPEYSLPFGELIPHDPKIYDMRRLVCDKGYRPPLLKCWQRNSVLASITELVTECWAVPEARQNTLNVKKRLKHLCELIGDDSNTCV